MTTNQTIDGVSRELLEQFLAGGRQCDREALRALLDAPACKVCNDTKKMHEPGQEPGSCAACFEDEVGHPQGESVNAKLREALEGMVEYFPEGHSDGECFSLERAREVLALLVDQPQGERVACTHGIRAPHACDQCEAQNAVPDYREDPDTGTCIDQWSKIQGLNGTEAYTVPLYRHAEQPAPVAVRMCDCNQGRLPGNRGCKPCPANDK